MGDDEDEVLLLDTSAAVALVVEDHEAHAAAVRAVRGRRLALAGHAWLETCSVLTRLPGELRRSPAEVARLLAHNFPEPGFLAQEAASDLAAGLASLGVSGGAAYDALVGAAARQHGRPLLSADTRARSVYEALGVRVRPLPWPGRAATLRARRRRGARTADRGPTRAARPGRRPARPRRASAARGRRRSAPRPGRRRPGRGRTGRPAARAPACRSPHRAGWPRRPRR